MAARVGAGRRFDGWTWARNQIQHLHSVLDCLRLGGVLGTAIRAAGKCWVRRRRICGPAHSFLPRKQISVIVCWQPDTTRIRRRHPREHLHPRKHRRAACFPFSNALLGIVPSTPPPLLCRYGPGFGHDVLGQNSCEALGQSVMPMDLNEGECDPPRVQSSPLSHIRNLPLDKGRGRPVRKRIRCPACSRAEMTRATVPTTRQLEEKARYTSERRQPTPRGSTCDASRSRQGALRGDARRLGSTIYGQDDQPGRDSSDCASQLWHRTRTRSPARNVHVAVERRDSVVLPLEVGLPETRAQRSIAFLAGRTSL
jgi:hypothetical protein